MYVLVLKLLYLSSDPCDPCLSVHSTYSVLWLYQGNFPFLSWLYFLAQCFTVHCYLRINFDSCLHSNFTISSNASTSQVLTGTFHGPIFDLYTQRKRWGREGGREDIQGCVNSPSFKIQPLAWNSSSILSAFLNPSLIMWREAAPKRQSHCSIFQRKMYFHYRMSLGWGRKHGHQMFFLWGDKEIYTHSIGMSMQMCVSLCRREGMCKISMLLLHVTTQFRDSMLHWQHSFAKLAWLWKNKVLIYSLSPPTFFSLTPPPYTHRDVRLFC